MVGLRKRRRRRMLLPLRSRRRRVVRRWRVQTCLVRGGRWRVVLLLLGGGGGGRRGWWWWRRRGYKSGRCRQRLGKIFVLLLLLLRTGHWRRSQGTETGVEGRGVVGGDRGAGVERNEGDADLRDDCGRVGGRRRNCSSSNRRRRRRRRRKRRRTGRRRRNGRRGDYLLVLVLVLVRRGRRAVQVARLLGLSRPRRDGRLDTVHHPPPYLRGG